MCNYLHPSTHRSVAPLGWKMLVPPVLAMKRMEGSGRAAYSIIPSQKIAKRKCTSRKVGAVTDLFAGIA